MLLRCPGLAHRVISLLRRTSAALEFKADIGRVLESAAFIEMPRLG
jgi:hypothetical protein